MGLNGRGMAHIQGFLAVPNVEIAFVCDVDKRALEKAASQVAKKQGKAPKAVHDFRRILDDKEVDVLSIAAPNHWHAPATILGCAAGKHVYVEKPGSHNVNEAELMVRAASVNHRLVQMGNQRRSWPWVIEAIAKVRAGEIGKVHYARTWYNALRPSIGRGRKVQTPEWLDYTLWQGPAPERPYVDNLVHYNWHWRWHWGGGELANNGIHALDLARWGLGVDCPSRVTCTGARYHHDDDQETPDTLVAVYDFGTAGIEWNCHSCDPRGFEGEGFGVTFYGDKASLVISGSNARLYDLKNKQLGEITGRWDDVLHFQNFAEAIREGKALNSPIAEGQRSTLLCHLGNISYRTGRVLKVDPKTKLIVGDPKATALRAREYRKGWKPVV